MITEIQKSKWLVIKGKTPLLYTTSDHKDIAVKKYENKEKVKFTEGKSLNCICADISVRDLSKE